MTDTLKGGFFATAAAFEFYVGGNSDSEFMGPFLFSTGGFFTYMAILCLIKVAKS